MKIGRFSIDPIIDGTAKVPIEDAVSHPEGKKWDCADHPTDESGLIRFDIGGFLVRLGDRKIMVDVGGGVFADDRHTTGDLLDNLRAAGVAPEEVTDICLTHLHWDHVGWSTTDGKVTFPNATIRAHIADWDHFMTGTTAIPQVREILSPIATRFEPFDSEKELFPGFIARPAPGHTPGTTIYIVYDGDDRALLLGDVLHTVGEATEPEWQGMWDLDPFAAGEIRNKIAQEIADTGAVFAPAHFPDLSFGRLVTADGLRRFSWALGSDNI